MSCRVVDVSRSPASYLELSVAGASEQRFKASCASPGGLLRKITKLDIESLRDAC